MEPRHAVAVVTVGRGSKRHALLEELAADEAVKEVVTFGVRFARAGSSLVMHLHRYPAETYTGKWTRSALRSWLLEVGYPLVNRMQTQFPPMKYLSGTTFGAVLVVKSLGEQTDALVQALEPWALKYRDRLKFSFFTKMGSTQQLCATYGIWSNDELLLLEDPRQVARKTHSHVPTAAKYRLERVVPPQIDRFFQEYEAKTWPRYFRSSIPKPPGPEIQDGIRELSGWDFAEVVHDPKASVLVEFVSSDCDACEEFAGAFQQVARRVHELQQREGSPLRDVVIARMDQSAHEHSELIKGTPWLRYWARGAQKRGEDVELRSAESILAFLEEHASDERGEERPAARSTSKGRRKGPPPRPSASKGGGGGSKHAGSRPVARPPPRPPLEVDEL